MHTLLAGACPAHATALVYKASKFSILIFKITINHLIFLSSLSWRFLVNRSQGHSSPLVGNPNALLSSKRRRSKTTLCSASVPIKEMKRNAKRLPRSCTCNNCNTFHLLGMLSHFLPRLNPARVCMYIYIYRHMFTRDIYIYVCVICLYHSTYISILCMCVPVITCASPMIQW